MKKLLFALLFAGVCFAQTNTNIQFVTSAPSGACTARANPQLLVPTGTLYTCQSAVWAAATTTGAPGTVTSVTGTAGQVCVATGTTTPVLSVCTALDLSGLTSTKPIKSGTSLPATCSVGMFYDKTDATAGQNLYSCTATNTWTAIGGSGGGGPAGAGVAYSLDGTTFASDPANFTYDPATGLSVLVDADGIGAGFRFFSNNGGVTVRQHGDDYAITGTSYADGDAEQPGGVGGQARAAGHAVTFLVALEAFSPNLGGGSATSAYGLLVDDQTGATDNYAIKAGLGKVEFDDLKTTGAATGKTVVCVDTATGILYASTSGTDCAN